MVGGCIEYVRIRLMSLFSIGLISGGSVSSAIGVGPRIGSSTSNGGAAQAAVQVAAHTVKTRARRFMAVSGAPFRP